MALTELGFGPKVIFPEKIAVLTSVSVNDGVIPMGSEVDVTVTGMASIDIELPLPSASRMLMVIVLLWVIVDNGMWPSPLLKIMLVSLKIPLPGGFSFRVSAIPMGSDVELTCT